jgi:soluble lytic murein transglycosylase-like protein
MFPAILHKNRMFNRARIQGFALRALGYMKAHPRITLGTCAALCLLAVLAPSMQQPAALNTQPVAVVAVEPAGSLSARDRELASTIFRAQRRGDFDWADELMAQMENQILFGHMLAQRYLSPKYDATASELTVWLANFSDQPEAARIRALAKRKGASSDSLAALPADDTTPLKGNGYVEHLGRRAMPDAFYSGLARWREGAYGPAYTQFNAASDAPKLNAWQQSAAHYWAYRAAKQTGDERAAYAHLAQAGDAPLTFYGQLANRQLGRTSALMAASPAVPTALREQPAVQRAQALAQAGEMELAEDSLRLLVMQLEPSQRPAVLALAGEFGLANLQVRLGGLDGLSTEEQRFAQYPMPPWFIAEQSSVDPALLLSIARQESVFRGDAKSHMGATGMMQMLPSTARHVERALSDDAIALASNDDSLPLSKQLNDPAVNIHLGAKYLSMLAKEKSVQHDLIRLIAAYNAGPGSVQNWQAAARNIHDPLLYIESIPYPETRNYVMQVMAHRWVYQTFMGQESDSLAALSQGQWPKVNGPQG